MSFINFLNCRWSLHFDKDHFLDKFLNRFNFHLDVHPFLQNVKSKELLLLWVGLMRMKLYVQTIYLYFLEPDTLRELGEFWPFFQFFRYSQGWLSHKFKTLWTYFTSMEASKGKEASSVIKKHIPSSPSKTSEKPLLHLKSHVLSIISSTKPP